MDEAVAWVVFDRPQRIEIAGVGQLVEVDDLAGLLGNALADEAAADEAGAAGDQNGIHRHSFRGD